MAFSLDGYIDVAERIRTFAEKYPDGRLRPADLDKPYTIEHVADATFIVYAAAAYRSECDQLPGIGIAWEPFPGKTPYTKDSELQNAETSAWGRAIVAALAADTQRGVASKQEVRNRQEDDEVKVPTTRRQPTPMPGFETMADQRKAHEEYEHLAARQSDAIKAALKRWRADEKLPYPMGAQDLGRAMAMLKASGVEGPEQHGDDTDEPAASPARVDEPVAAPSTPDDPAAVKQPAIAQAEDADGGGLNVPGEAVPREGSVQVEQVAASSPLGLEGSSPGTINYETWERYDLVAECASRGIDVRVNASVQTMAEKLRAWDRTYL